MFKLHSKFEPTGDQPEAIKSLVNGIEKGLKWTVLKIGIDGMVTELVKIKFNRNNFNNL